MTVKERMLIKIFLAGPNSTNFPYIKEFLIKQTNHLTRLCKQYNNITSLVVVVMVVVVVVVVVGVGVGVVVEVVVGVVVGVVVVVVVVEIV